MIVLNIKSVCLIQITLIKHTNSNRVFIGEKTKQKKKNTSKKQVELGDFLTFAVLSAYIVLAEYIKSFLAFSIT